MIKSTEHDGIRVKVITRSTSASSNEYFSRTRVYGAMDALSPELTKECDRWTNPPVTEQFRHENPREADRIMKGYRTARRRAIADAKRKLNALLVKVTDELGLDGDGKEIAVARFSTEAGCSCGCSPGFILQATVRMNVTMPVDIFVESIDKPRSK